MTDRLERDLYPGIGEMQIMAVSGIGHALNPRPNGAKQPAFTSAADLLDL